MPNIDLKYARSNTTGTSGEGGSEQPRGEEGERAGELLRDRSEWQPVGPSVLPWQVVRDRRTDG